MSKTALYLALAAAGTAGVLAVMLGTGTIDWPAAQDPDAPAPNAAVEPPRAPSAPSSTGPETPLVADEPALVAPPEETAEDPTAAPAGTTDNVALVELGDPDPESVPAEMTDAPEPESAPGETPEVAAGPAKATDAPELAPVPFEARETPDPAVAPTGTPVPETAPVRMTDALDPPAMPVEPTEAPDPAVAPVEVPVPVPSPTDMVEPPDPAPVETAEGPAPVGVPSDMAEVPDPATAPIAPVETPEVQAAPVEAAKGPGALNPEPDPAPVPSVAAPVDSVVAPDVTDPAPANALSLPAPVDTAAMAPGASVPAPAPTAPEPSDAAPKAIPGPNADAGTAMDEPVIDGDATALRPSFDVVRAETDGFALVAGGGQPGSRIEVLVNGEPLESLEIGGDGKFSTFLNLSPDEASVISLRMTGDKKDVVSEDEVIVAPVQVADDATPAGRPVAPEPGKTVLEPDPEQAPAETDEIAAAVADVTTEEVADAAPVPAPMPESATPRAGGAPTDPLAAPTDELAARAVPEPEAGAAPAPLAAPGTGTAAPVAPEGGDGPLAAMDADALRLGTEPANRAPGTGTDPGAPPVVGGADPVGLAAPEAGDGEAPERPVTDDPDVLARAQPEPGMSPGTPRPPAVLLSSPRGVEALSTDPISPGDVALDSISYDEEGDVLLSGRGKTSDFVRIYLDNTPVTTSRIREDGRWRVQLPEVDQGAYVLRVDQINERGQVTARVESPFLRESTAVLERAVASGGGGFSTVTIQPGNTLWGISRERYGEGMQYVRIFEANRDRIRDPDLIYPGQLFDLPGGGTD